ncbi:MAG: hypothetical protein ACLSA2_07885 [Candidatus Gastranaerophilaceae bacterium]
MVVNNSWNSVWADEIRLGDVQAQKLKSQGLITSQSNLLLLKMSRFYPNLSDFKRKRP